MTRPEIWDPSIAEAEAVIAFNDTFSDSRVILGAPPQYDFDAVLTHQARNIGCFSDREYPIGGWPQTGDYGAVLLSQLRQEQKRIYGVFEEYGRTNFPDAQVLEGSLGRMLIGVVNWAPRRKDHHENGQNGDDFFIAELDDNIQIVSQLRFLRGVASRGLVQALWRIKDDNPVWPKGEQYRSSIAKQLRNFPEGLIIEDLSLLPKDERDALTLAYGDKYGNGRIEQPDGVDIPGIVKDQEYSIRVDGKPLRELDGTQTRVIGVTELPEIPQDRVGVYINPADKATDGVSSSNIRYLEIARRVEDPNTPSNSAYETLRRTVLPNSEQHPSDWSQVEIELAA